MGRTLTKKKNLPSRELIINFPYKGSGRRLNERKRGGSWDGTFSDRNPFTGIKHQKSFLDWTEFENLLWR